MTYQIKKNEGRSIVEVMIALALGLLVILALSTLFLTNSRTHRLTDDKARMEQEGRLALNLLAFHIRMAGSGVLVSTKPYGKDPFDKSAQQDKSFISRVYTNLAGGVGASKAGIQNIQGCANGFANTGVASTVALIPCNPGTGNDAISVRYVVDGNNSNTTAAAIPVDCLGSALIAVPDADRPGVAPDFYIAENRFYVVANGDTSELYCRGNGTTPDGADFANPHQPLVENVEQMRITYGVSSTGGQNVDRQVTAEQAAVLGWDRVISAQICLLMRTANRVVDNNQQYRDCGNNIINVADGRLRATYSTTVVIRARASGNI